MVDLAPSICRQRLVIEGVCAKPLEEREIAQYLEQLADVCDMVRLISPVMHRSEQFGWAGWVHWETSGAHLYAWERPVAFFSVDIYTCKAFDVDRVVEFTETFFSTKQLVFKEF